MRYVVEEDLRYFDFWSGARYTASCLTSLEFDEIEVALTNEYGDDLTDTTINDVFWFERDWIAEVLGYDDWDALVEERESKEDDNES